MGTRSFLPNELLVSWATGLPTSRKTVVCILDYWNRWALNRWRWAHRTLIWAAALKTSSSESSVRKDGSVSSCRLACTFSSVYSSSRRAWRHQIWWKQFCKQANIISSSMVSQYRCCDRLLWFRSMVGMYISSSDTTKNILLCQLDSPTIRPALFFTKDSATCVCVCVYVWHLNNLTNSTKNTNNIQATSDKSHTFQLNFKYRLLDPLKHKYIARQRLHVTRLRQFNT